MTHASDPAARPKTRLRRSPQAMAALKLQILERARAICRDEGLQALSMRRMADEFGLSPMSLYSYYPSKQALLSSLWVEVFEALVARLLAAAQGQRAPAQVLEAHLRTLFEFWEQREDQYRMIYVSGGQLATGDLVDIEHEPIYGKLLLLTQDRVAACLRGPSEPGEQTIRMLADLVVAKVVGYLHLTLGISRYPVLDRALLRERMVSDILEMVERAT